MKVTKFLAMLLCGLTMCFGFASCGDDDDDEDNSAVIGTWVGDDYDHFYSNVSLTFSSNGTGTGTIEHRGSYTSVCRMSFTYKVSGNKITTKGTRASGNSDGESNTSAFNITLELSGGKLYVKGGDNWYKGNVRSLRK